MADHKLLYIYSKAEAQKYGELELWRESHKENCKCARAIEDAISSSFDGCTLQGGCAAEIISRFGFNRVNFVLSNTIREKSYDGRFSPSNKDWSMGIYVPKNDSNWAFIVESHPAVLDGFINLTRQAWRELGLYDKSHCTDRLCLLCDQGIFCQHQTGWYFADPNCRRRTVYVLCTQRVCRRF